MKFLVKYNIEDEYFVMIEAEREIFNRMDLNDCYDITICDLRIAEPSQYLRECSFHGIWHDGHDPLRMEIRDAYSGEVLAIGYGTDH